MIGKETLDAFIEANREDSVQLLMTLGKIPAPSHQEDQRAAFCKKWFQQEGCSEVWIDGAKNVVCKFNCDRYDHITVLMAHMDVVFDDTGELPMSRSGDILRAPGIGDDTANLVNLMMGTRFLIQHKAQLKTGIMIVANTCEEGLGNLKGCKEIFSNYGDRIREFYSFDGYLSQCTSTAVGSHRYRMQVLCEGGHSYLNFGRDNAIQIAAELIHQLYQITPPQEEYTTYNVGRIEGGSTVNSIAQEATMLYEYRSSSEHCLQIMQQAVKDTVERFRADGKTVNLEVLGIRPGCGDGDKTALRAWTERNIGLIRQYYTGEMDLGPYSTDANIPLSRNVLANTIGTIRGGGAHTREEWVDLNSLPIGMGVVLSILSQYFD